MSSQNATGQRTDAQVIGERIGRAIARDVIREDMPREWTGIDPQDADQLTAAGIAIGSDEWDEAVAAAEAEYRRTLGE